MLRVFQQAEKHPILSIQFARENAGVSFPAASQAVIHMQRLGILREITGKHRRRLFAYEAYMSILNEGTEPLPQTRRRKT